MDISFIGHSSFRIKTRSVSIITDPFDPTDVGIKFPKVASEIVTVSHNHKDHNYVQGVTDCRKVVEGPGEYEIAGVSIIGMGSYHDSKKGSDRGENTIYIFEADELRIAHLGDLGYVLSDDEVEEIGEINVLMIPIGGIYTINVEEAVKVMRSIQPNITIPMHYKESGLSDQFEKLSGVDEFIKEAELQTEKLPKLSVSASELTDVEKIVVLEKKL